MRAPLRGGNPNERFDGFVLNWVNLLRYIVYWNNYQYELKHICSYTIIDHQDGEMDFYEMVAAETLLKKFLDALNVSLIPIIKNKSNIMRFYVLDGEPSQILQSSLPSPPSQPPHRIYVTFPRPIETRSEIPDYFEIYCQICGINKYFSRNDVHAEAETNSMMGGAALGGLIGALAGPEGIIIGGFIGGLLGANADSEEQRRVRRFEQSW